MIIQRNTENLDGTTRDFFRVPFGLETQILTDSPGVLPVPGFVKLYLKNGSLYYIDENGIETNIMTDASITYAVHEFNFTFETVSPYTLISVVEFQRIMRVGIIVVVPFDDPATTLSIGHTGNANGLMSVNDNDPTFAAYYEVEANFKYGGPDVIKLYVNPGNSIQGSGTLFLEVNRD